MDLILASSSPYRRRLLERLQLPFRCASPAVDETPRAGEGPAQLAARLGRDKASALARREPAAWVLGSDQVAALGTQVLGKPGSHERAARQLARCAGRSVTFYTGVSLLGPGYEGSRLVRTEVDFRALDAGEIAYYLRCDEPYDCAGSFKWESLGIALFRGLRGEDPTALEGLPLIATCDLLAEAGYPVLATANRAGSSER